MPMKFGGGVKCAICTKTVYSQEETKFESLSYHNDCFCCSICNKKIQSVSSAGAMHGKVSHKKCFSEQFKTSGGKYGGEKVVAGALSGSVSAGTAAASAPAPAKKEAPAPAPAAAAPAKQEAPVEEKVEEKPAAAATPAVKPATKPIKAKKAPSTTESAQKDKVFIENYDGKADKGLAEKPIEYECVKQNDKIVCGVFVGNCNDCTVVIKGKAKNVTISGCSKLSIQVENCVTTIEIVNSKQCNVQATDACGTFTIDKCDRTKVYLADNSCKGDMSTLVFSSASTSSNLYFSTEDGEDQVEYAVPERFLSTFHIGSVPVTNVDSELEMS